MKAKHYIIVGILIFAFFGAGWFFSEMSGFAAGVRAEKHTFNDSLQVSAVKSDRPSNDEILDLLIKNADRTNIEFHKLYDSLYHFIPEDKNESSVIVEKLKSKGFKVANWGRGNHPPLGPRIVVFSMVKDDCQCDVSKIYYCTVAEDVFEVGEAVECSKKK